ncbi:MAG: hypothetical protein ABI690_32670, partial [Chloroflexota bacterium]
MKSAFWPKIVSGLGWCAFTLVMSAGILAAQDVEPAQPNPVSTQAVIAVQVQPDHYKRICNPVHALLFDGNYQAFLEAQNFRLDEDNTLVTDYGASYENAGWQYVPQTISTFGLTAAYAWCESGDPVALQLAVSQ